jgi:hypothetical protein
MSAKAERKPVVENAEEARDLDYAYQVFDRVVLVGYGKIILVSALITYLGVSVILALVLVVAGAAWALWLRAIFGRERRRRLGQFAHPATGELSVPGGPRRLTWGEFCRMFVGRRPRPTS